MIEKKPNSPLWATGGEELDEQILQYSAGEDATLDNELLADDLVASAAHVRGLCDIGLLSDQEAETLTGHLSALLEQFRAGTFRVGKDDEDGHSAIERVLVERAGEVGKKVHTGRSRNDQVLVATRLWLRRELAGIGGCVLEAARACLEKARALESVLLPGYTHLQRAVPSTAGFFFAGHAESLIEDAEVVRSVDTLLDACPLGTAAGYGVNLPLARERVADELEFSRLQVNGLAAQNSRGRFALHALSALLMPLQTVRRLAWDLSLFTTQEFGFVQLPDRWCTGPSIMPNKRNPDVVELMRAAFGEIAGAHAELLQILSLPSGYQRDLQRTKPPLLRGVRAARQTLELLPRLVRDITIDEAAAARALEKELFATDRAVDLAREGVPFRVAYQRVKSETEGGAEGDLLERARQSIRARISPGGPGALELSRIETRLNEVAGQF